MGAHGFSGKKLGPTWGTVYRKWKIKNHCQDSKIDQRSVNNSKKGYKRNTQITNNQSHPQNNLYWEWKKMVRIHYWKFLTKFVYLTRKLWSQESFCKPTILLSVKRRIPVSIFPVRNMFKDISGVYNRNANKPVLSNYDEETMNLDTGNQKSLCQE